MNCFSALFCQTKPAKFIQFPLIGHVCCSIQHFFSACQPAPVGMTLSGLGEAEITHIFSRKLNSKGAKICFCSLRSFSPGASCDCICCLVQVRCTGAHSHFAVDRCTPLYSKTMQFLRPHLRQASKASQGLTVWHGSHPHSSTPIIPKPE